MKNISQDELTKSVKTVSITAKTLPNLKLNQIYSHDVIQLNEGLKQIEHKKENANKIIKMLSIIRKKSQIKIYDFPEITQSIRFIHNIFKDIEPSYQVSFLYTLSKIQLFDEEKPSLNNENLVYSCLEMLTNNISKLEIRSLSNLIYSLHTFQLKNPKIYNFNTVFTELEEKIILQIKTSKIIQPLDLTNIVLAYSKTQNGSEEFYRIIQDYLIDLKDKLKPQDLAIVIYSYANNPNCNEKILEVVEENIYPILHLCKGKEICSMLRGYYKRKMLNENLKKKFREAIINKHEYTNATDLAYFFLILADEKEIKFMNYLRKCIGSLYFTFKAGDLSIILGNKEKAELMQKIDKELFETLKKKVLILIKKKEISGYELRKIYEGLKDLKFEGKYNIFCRGD